MWSFFRFTVVRRIVELIAAMMINFGVGAALTAMGFELYISGTSISTIILPILGNAFVAPLLFFTLLLYAPVATFLEALVWLFNKRLTLLVTLAPCLYSLFLLIGLTVAAWDGSGREIIDNGFLYGMVVGTVLFTTAQYVIGREAYEQIVKEFTPSKPRSLLTEDAIDPKP